MDKEVAFTKFDGEKEGPLRGNANLRRQVKLSKSTLGYCAPLALQTNGKSRTWKDIRDIDIMDSFFFFLFLILKEKVTFLCSILSHSISQSQCKGAQKLFSCPTNYQCKGLMVVNRDVMSDWSWTPLKSISSGVQREETLKLFQFNFPHWHDSQFKMDDYYSLRVFRRKKL